MWMDKIMPQTQSSNNFTAMRWILAVMVLYTHAYGLLLFPEPTLLHRTFGIFAVQSFFVVSGYFITRSYLRMDNFFMFMRNRALRLLPALILAIYLSRLLASAHNGFIDNPVPYIVNGPIWTLSWEVVCYGICALLGVAGLLNQACFGGLLTGAWLVYLSFPGTGDTYNVIAPLFLLFASGGFIALNENRLRLNQLGFAATAILLFLLLDSRMLLLDYVFRHIPFLYGPSWPTAKWYAVIYLAVLPFSLLWLGKYFYVSLVIKNDYSYGLYIYGWPVQQVLVARLDLSPPMLFFLSLFITQLLAMGSWHLVEKRILKFKR